jgi:tRNA nucleotidyltransferase (CCA-adding enzyme)
VWRIETAAFMVELWPLGFLTLEDDILRRDFSCNALMWQLPRGPLIDRIGGLDDLREGRIRALSKINLRDDPVRLLRAARFVAQLDDFELVDETTAWIRELGPCLAWAPRARVGRELFKLLEAGGAHRGLRAMLEFGLLEASAPPSARIDGGWLERNLEAARLLAAPRSHPIPSALREAGDAARLTLLLRAWGAPPIESSADYGWNRVPRRRAVRAAALLDQAVETVGSGSADRRELIHLAGEAFPALLAVGSAVAAIASADIDPWRRWWAQWQRQSGVLVRPAPLVSSGEVKALARVADGPLLGRLLGALRRAQVRGEVRSAGGARRWLRDSSSEIRNAYRDNRGSTRDRH